MNNILRFSSIAMSLLLIFMTAACGKQEKPATGEFPSIPDTYSRELAAKNGDVVIWGFSDNSYNIGKWTQFLNHYHEETPSQVRITRDTMEGGFVIEEYYFDGKQIYYQYDTTRDNWASNGGGVYNSVCKGFTTVELDRGPFYTLSGCIDQATNEPSGSDGMWVDIKRYKDHEVP
ncbi:DUF4362 domain-containing protein [Paenibacillus albus]|uniref:DUF4362 domain-containing protein n=1 Tax=Paenibacillus albus TaxID=2495582 RepID=A0A3S9A6L9_9BACL|nr:DUF4362 domain-containing protein [Paenibacillus albus]AZN41351.1 DUF4362 domain-containing protein [Paenibacillus albus]